ncbi:MAG TPA: TonB-dependent receptor, partial [Porphyromonadaceae bacterium]|nr:TonB-dependent receptor [Porphyromonadaceae bacterium]
MKIIKLLRWKRVGLSSTILFVFILALLNTFDSFADDYFPESQPSFNIQQQKRQIAGIVTDAKGEAVIGANIIEKGTTNGTVTDNNGGFSLTLENDGILQISYIGYLTQEVNTVGQTTVTITLQEDTQALDELVVVGYGTMKKSDLTGAVSRVTLDDKTSLPNMNLSQALSGTMAGVNLSSRGMAGGDADISIRGQTTLSASKSPLIVLDGIIFNGRLNDINVSDIEYIDVLKDASAAAVYGSRSANGVIIITTKKGRSEKPKITV